MRAARLHLQHEPFALDARELGDVQAWDEQAVVAEAHRNAIPAEHTYISSGMWAKAGSPYVDTFLVTRALPSRGLDLQADEAMRVDVPGEDLDGLEVGKRPKEIQRRRLGKTPDDLGLAQEPLESSIDEKRVLFRRRQSGRASEP